MYRSNIGPAIFRPGTNRTKDDQALISFVEDNATRLKNSARRYSLCTDDAHDAWQHSLEILITRAPARDRSGLLAWMHTVIKHEALAVRRSRLRMLEGVGEEFDPSELVCENPGPHEQFERRERIVQASTALQLIKHPEATCLLLKAKGFSYNEISEITGFSWTKVNRSISEGRKSFLQLFDAIGRGE